MRNAYKVKKETCFSPWLGFMVIVAVCIIIAGGIFIESKTHPRKHRRTHLKPVPQAAPAQQVAFPNPADTGVVPDRDSRIVF
ncbi:MAG: hypothetical protein HQL26_00215 [Candidatus Omnitrophica bacterium]|nr:hypothetical protein [Candidatus Omnitrophota bacterium]